MAINKIGSTLRIHHLAAGDASAKKPVAGHNSASKSLEPQSAASAEKTANVAAARERDFHAGVRAYELQRRFDTIASSPLALASAERVDLAQAVPLSNTEPRITQFYNDVYNHLAKQSSNVRNLDVSFRASQSPGRMKPEDYNREMVAATLREFVLPKGTKVNESISLARQIQELHGETALGWQQRIDSTNLAAMRRYQAQSGAKGKPLSMRLSRLNALDVTAGYVAVRAAERGLSGAAGYEQALTELRGQGKISDAAFRDISRAVTDAESKLPPPSPLEGAIGALTSLPGKALDAVNGFMNEKLGAPLREKLLNAPFLGTGDSRTIELGGNGEIAGQRLEGQLTMTAARGAQSRTTLSVDLRALAGRNNEKYLREGQSDPFGVKGELRTLVGGNGLTKFSFENENELRRVTGDFLQYVAPKLALGGLPLIASDEKARRAIGEMMRHLDTVQAGTVGSVTALGQIGNSSKADKAKGALRTLLEGRLDARVTGEADIGLTFKDGNHTGYAARLNARGQIKGEAGFFTENNSIKGKSSLSPLALTGAYTVNAEARTDRTGKTLTSSLAVDYSARATAAGNAPFPLGQRITVTVETTGLIDGEAASLLAQGKVEQAVERLAKAQPNAKVTLITGDETIKGADFEPRFTAPGGILKGGLKFADRLHDRESRSGSATGGEDGTPWINRLGEHGITTTGKPANVLKSINYVEALIRRAQP